jgi:hypothetical protein
MGIDNVAIKTFNSTGAQSVCRANEADSSKLIESEFLTKCTTEYINGSGMSFINGTIGLRGDPGSRAGPEDFYLPSDCDAISDVIYNGVKISSIARIDVIIGQLTAQTIYPYDIISRNSTELGYTTTPDDPTFSIPFIGRAKNGINSFLQAGAATNQMRLRVTYRAVTISPTDTSICVFSHQITNTEKNFIAKNIVNRPIHTSQSATKSAVGEKPAVVSAAGNIVDLSGININVSHILISDATSTETKETGTHTLSGTTVTITLASHGLSIGDTVNITFEGNAEDGLYVVATVPTTDTFTVTTVSSETNSTPITCTVAQAGLKNAELILGNDRTGVIPANMLKTKLNAELFSLAGGDENVYIIKTADSAFSTAGIPFARLSNTQLKLTAYNQSSANVYVTVCGTQVQTTVGGTISFSA